MKHSAHAALVLVFALVVGCGFRAAPPAVTYKPPRNETGQSQPVAAGAVLVSEVKVLETKELPDGFHYEQTNFIPMAVAADFPTASAPNRYLGTISVERTTANEKNEPPNAEALALLANEAAKRGANTLVRYTSRRDMLAYGAYRHHTFYHALFVSSATPELPTVEALLSKLPLASEGFKEVRRFTAQLEDLGGRPSEAFSLKRGHEYRFAMAYHPKPVEIPERAPLGYLVTNGESSWRGGFTSWVDRPRHKGFSTSHIDGVFARAGAARIGHDLFGSTNVTISFASALGPHVKQANEPVEAGRGTAEFVLYERALSANELTDASCNRCIDVARACSTRRELDRCTKLQECFKQISMPLSGCNKAYEKI